MSLYLFEVGRQRRGLGHWPVVVDQAQPRAVTDRSDHDAYAEETRYFERTYGPSKNSQYEEEWLIRDFFKDRRGGVLLDVGASHYQRFSNTYNVEHELGGQASPSNP